MIKLYDLEFSGNCYKIRLFLNLLGLDHELVKVDVMGGEHKQPAFMALNPKGQVPALEDNGQIVCDSQAILVYLAGKYAPSSWYVEDPLKRAEIQTWLSTSANEIGNGPGRARLAKLFGMDVDYDAAVKVSDGILPVIDQHLKDREWLVGAGVTIADIAAFPYVALAGDGEISLEPYANIRAWINRIKALPGFIGMPGIEVAAGV